MLLPLFSALVHLFINLIVQTNGQCLQEFYDNGYQDGLGTITCYKYYGTTLSWDIANNKCISNGGHLLFPLNFEDVEAIVEFSRIQDEFRDEPFDGYLWLGITKKRAYSVDETTWVYSDPQASAGYSPQASYFNW